MIHQAVITFRPSSIDLGETSIVQKLFSGTPLTEKRPMMMRHFPETQTYQTTRPRLTTHALALSWWQILGITASLCLGLASEGLASHAVHPSSLTYYAVQGATNPPKQTLTFTKTPTYRATLTASDNATWLTVSPTSQSETTRATLTVTVNISGRAAGTYRATITSRRAPGSLSRSR